MSFILSSGSSLMKTRLSAHARTGWLLVFSPSNRGSTSCTGCRAVASTLEAALVIRFPHGRQCLLLIVRHHTTRHIGSQACGSSNSRSRGTLYSTFVLHPPHRQNLSRGRTIPGATDAARAFQELKGESVFLIQFHDSIPSPGSRGRRGLRARREIPRGAPDPPRRNLPWRIW